MVEITVPFVPPTGDQHPSFMVRYPLTQQTAGELKGLLNIREAMRCAAKRWGLVYEEASGLLLCDFRPHRCPKCGSVNTYGIHSLETGTLQYVCSVCHSGFVLVPQEQGKEEVETLETTDTTPPVEEPTPPAEPVKPKRPRTRKPKVVEPTP